MNHNIKIAVTGGSGLLGAQILDALHSEGFHNLHALHVSGFIPKILVDKNIQWTKGDIQDYGTLEDFLIDVDLVIHTAAVVSFKKTDLVRMNRINIDGTRDLVNHLIGGDTKLIHISSIATLGRKDNGGVIDENVFWDENLPHSDYAKSKFIAEMEVYRGISEGLEAMILQPSIVLGRTERNTSSSSIWTQISKMPTLAPQGANGFVDVIDVAEYVVNSMNNWQSGQKYIISGHNLSYQELYRKANASKGNNNKIRALKPFFLLAILPFMQLLFKLIGQNSPIGKDAILTTSKSYQFDNSKSIETFGNHYSSIESSIGRYYQDI